MAADVLSGIAAVATLIHTHDFSHMYASRCKVPVLPYVATEPTIAGAVIVATVPCGGAFLGGSRVPYHQDIITRALVFPIRTSSHADVCQLSTQRVPFPEH